MAINENRLKSAFVKIKFGDFHPCSTLMHHADKNGDGNLSSEEFSQLLEIQNSIVGGQIEQ